MASSSPDDLDLLTRLACFSTEDGLYNVLTNDNLKLLTNSQCTRNIASSKEKSLAAIQRLRKIFHQKSFVKKEPILFALASLIRNSVPPKDHKEDEVRQQAYKLAQDMCETAKDLFTFVHLDKTMTQPEPAKVGWGRGMRALVSNYYESKPALGLAKEVTKYKSARGFTHRDLIRQCHLKPNKKGKGTAAVLGYLTHGKEELEKFDNEEDKEVQEVLTFLRAVNSLGGIDLASEKEILRSVVESHSLEVLQLPTQCLQIKESFEGVINQMSHTDLFRAVPKMAALGMLEATSPTVGRIVDKIADVDSIKADKISPVVIFSSQKKYEVNRGKKWVRNQDVINAFIVAYHASLQVVPKNGKRNLLAVHIGSKVTKMRVIGSNWLSPVMPCVVMAQMLLQAEEQLDVVFFNTKITELKLNKDMSTVAVLEQILKPTKDPLNASLDLCEPLTWATNNRKPYDNILLMSDKKMVSSINGFHQAVRQYRSGVVPEAKVAIVGLSDTSILADPNDLGLLDIAGFNETVPELINKFFVGFNSES